MSTALDTPIQPWRPEDTFAARLAVVRHTERLGYMNVSQAAAMCGLPAATWHTWEHGVIPQNIAEIADRISRATGIDRDWLLWGGDLAPRSTKWSIGDDETAGQGPLGYIGQQRFRLTS